MAKEIEGRIEELQEGLVGKESWVTEQYQNQYNKEVDGIAVYEAKPWDIEVGDVLKLRPKEILEKLEATEEIPAHWFEELHTYFEENVHTITVDEEVYQAIYKNEAVVKSLLFDADEELYWHISLPMLTYANDKEFKEEEEVEEEKAPIFSIKELRKDPQIIKEMIKKVDKKRLKVLLNISASLGEDARVIVDNKIVDEYLEKWANAKYEFYLLFGKEFSITKDIELEISTDEMRTLKGDLSRRFPQYGIYIDNIDTQEFIQNEMHSSYLSSSPFEYAKHLYTRGMKVSKFFSQFLQDSKFDIELSKMLQNKMTTGTVFLSIDPYDYLTSSINQHGWKSCHRITNGEWATGSLSYLLDETTIVAYRAKRDEEFDYNYWGFKFKGNSKLHRQLVYFDKKTCSIIFGRQYPNDHEELSKAIRHLLEDKVATYLGTENEWKVYRNKFDGEFNDVNDMHYSDVHNDFAFKFARLTKSREGVANWNVGSFLPCLCGCGDNVDKRGERAICSKCKTDPTRSL